MRAEIWNHCIALGHVADVGAYGCAIVLQAFAKHSHTPALRRNQTQKQFEQGTFAGAVRAKQADGCGLQHEIHLAQRLKISVALRNAA